MGDKDDALPHKRNLDSIESGLNSRRKRTIRSKQLVELNEDDAPHVSNRKVLWFVATPLLWQSMRVA
jgi:hypothetical protein